MEGRVQKTQERPTKINTKKTSSARNKQNARLCIACEGSNFEQYVDKLVRCASCGLISLEKIPTFDELKRLYEKEYFFGMEYSDYMADRLALEKNFKQRIKFLNKYVSDSSVLVEIGCAYGYFLNLLKDEVKWHKGFDVSKDSIDYAKKEFGINATSGDFLDDKELKPSSVDLICMWDLIEHLGEPHMHIAKASQLLKKGGVLSLTTGDISSWVARRRGANWRMIHPPTHIHYFSPESIEQLLQRYGMKISKIRYKPTYRNTGSVFNQLIVNRKAKESNAGLLEAGYKVAKATGLDKLNIPLNLYDVMEVTAIKV
jgi:SAM-dependent methyltransferase